MSIKMFEPVCFGCGKSLGLMDEGELRALEDCSNGLGCLCFVCEPEPSSVSPSIFSEMHGNEIFQIGDTSLKLDWKKRGYPVLVELRAHERTLMHGLSSYTKVNRNTEFWGVLENLYDDRICPGCNGLSFNHELYGVHPCQVCGDRGSIKVLKKWLVSLLDGTVKNV